MKNRHSITDICLYILRAALCVGVAVSVIKYLIDSGRQERIVISGLPQNSQAAQVTTIENTTADTVYSSSAVTSSVIAEVPEETPEESPPATTGSADDSGTPEEIQTARGTTVPAETSAVYTAGTAAAPSETMFSSSSEPNGLINLNTASASQLMELKGIGEVKAAAIIKYREQNGAFHSIDEILNVKGIGEKTFEKIRSQITV